MQINFKVRIRNKLFWLALIPAVLILVQTVCALFGVPITVENVESRLLDLVNAVFAVLAILGIVADPTTEGLQDSDRAMTYDKPWDDADYQVVGKHEA
ncbi:MAG: phage holin [Eubacterium sp.]|nr:phage holin [Eubacterium sp.]